MQKYIYVQTKCWTKLFLLNRLFNLNYLIVNRLYASELYSVLGLVLSAGNRDLHCDW